MATEELSLDLNSEPVCPFCGYKETDAWEMDFGPGLDGETDHTCGRCGEEYLCAREVSVYYSTSKKP